MFSRPDRPEMPTTDQLGDIQVADLATPNTQSSAVLLREASLPKCPSRTDSSCGVEQQRGIMPVLQVQHASQRTESAVESVRRG